MKGRTVEKVRRKWTYLKCEIAKKYRLQKNPPTGGGKFEPLTQLESEILDFLQMNDSKMLDGHPSGRESQVY